LKRTLHSTERLEAGLKTKQVFINWKLYWRNNCLWWTVDRIL